PENKDFLADPEQMMLLNSILASCYRQMGDVEKAKAAYMAIIEAKTGSEFNLLRKYAEWHLTGLNELNDIKRNLQKIEELTADLRKSSSTKKSTTDDAAKDGIAPPKKPQE
ncbi:MAG: hypothetical protein O3A00_08210, partial [Planctomycetota bacterium]|nr:hypothetical protein [Planctomycetota bacterium]